MFNKLLQVISMGIQIIDNYNIKRFLYGNENTVRSKWYYIFSISIDIIIFILDFTLSLTFLYNNKLLDIVLLLLFSSPFLIGLVVKSLSPQLIMRENLPVCDRDGESYLIVNVIKRKALVILLTPGDVHNNSLVNIRNTDERFILPTTIFNYQSIRYLNNNYTAAHRRHEHNII